MSEPMKPAQEGTPALKCSLYVNGVRVKDQKTAALMFKAACLASSETVRLLRERASQSVNAADGELMRKAAEELEKAQIKPAQDGTPPMWMIFFEDHQLRPELFTDEPAARHRFKQCLLNWSCHLFVEDRALADVRQPSRAMTIPDRIDELIVLHNSLRAVARVLKMDPAYLLRLHSGEKDNPSAATLRKLGLRKVVHYTRRKR